MMTKLLCSLICLFLMSIPAGAFPSLTPLWTNFDDTIVDTQALTINSYGRAINGLPYQQEAVLTFNGWQYMTFYKGTGTPDTISGYVCVARRKLAGGNGFQIGTQGALIQSMFSLSWPSTDWQIIELSDYTFTSNDAHNMISMGICPK